MVVIGKQAGRLGNQLFLFGHFIADAREQGYQVSNPGFYPYARHFKTTATDLWCRYPSRPSPCARSIRLRAALYWPLRYGSALLARTRNERAGALAVIDITQSRDPYERVLSLADDEFSSLRRRSGILVARGWVFRADTAFVKHAAAIRDFFTPIDAHLARVSELIRRARNDCDVLVGIHIRHGDYRHFAGGQYFYDVATYRRFMEQAQALFPLKRASFLVCSDVPQDVAAFAPLRFMFGTGNLVEDMYAFARCDYLIGPPSTYTGWASFYGNVPTMNVATPTEEIALEKFRIWCG